MQSIEEYEWTIKTYNVLKRSGINFVEDIHKMSYADITSLKNIHRKSVEEIESKLNIEFR
ncbi:DNA-directed RNA polymerase subunit alpha C-terminal domain-containing protein [Paenibacillus sp. FSL H7-0331]|uniref:DNA-directed RNA polymerase subunit alpha C-terminal domain-containing protein n=1 Tax=Paenibacillus sp. FSL H7-0331 TaxID=1920421 RepID=UPI00096F630C|nr:DNA-directed RNA polymerase subunit alpha C-terminal domain-containing protein [Paenibacillus sp. FSL H7-0331]OMF19835.1 hypothetical protein BK127_02700 [Paenibacillus sp. FSL H7-0331]